ncbi:PREDICTED: uncharacterized protein LOC104801838 isoform X2 [Tarenaya hassleriana]|nr:PREDICTED: uncharacterized protein LOC104801838 isoform X2 [Tarenaya hassleriana]XP_010523523.1 PREDICTED: uncharacterized protein LOC104801838 isoform X2 [Tarenaya hassleriana]
MFGHHSSEPMTDDSRKEVNDSHFSVIEKEGSVFDLGKNVTACDLAEIVVCYKENAYNVVKDICVDEGIMPRQEKFSSNKNESCKRISNQFGSEDHVKAEVNVNPLTGTLESKIAGIMSKESFTLADIISMEDGQKSPEERSFQKSSLERVTLAPKIEPFPDEVTAPEENRSCSKNEPRRSEPEHYVHRHGYTLEDPDDVSSHFPSGFGETEPVSGHITYSGPIVFSGSLSVRSDGSTTSARSFAFPVLQSEWNSSPVRMAKADKRHIRTQKSWRHTLCCCSF